MTALRKYKIVIVECMNARQFSGYIEAASEEEAIKQGKEAFAKEHPELSAQFRSYSFGPELWRG